MKVRASDSASALTVIVTGLALVQIVMRSGIGGGYAFTTPVPIALGCIVLSVLLRTLNGGAAIVHPSMPAPIDGSQIYANFLSLALLYIASTHVNDAVFGWWLAAALIAQALWFFVVYAVLNAAGATDRAVARLQDRLVVAALSGIATAIIWSLHAAVLLRTELLGACFLLALFFDVYLSRSTVTAT